MFIHLASTLMGYVEEPQSTPLVQSSLANPSPFLSLSPSSSPLHLGGIDLPDNPPTPFCYISPFRSEDINAQHSGICNQTPFLLKKPAASGPSPPHMSVRFDVVPTGQSKQECCSCSEKIIAMTSMLLKTLLLVSCVL